MYQVPDPAWKVNPDIVAEESYEYAYGDDVYVPDAYPDEEEEEEEDE